MIPVAALRQASTAMLIALLITMLIKTLTIQIKVVYNGLSDIDALYTYQIILRCYIFLFVNIVSYPTSDLSCQLPIKKCASTEEF